MKTAPPPAFATLLRRFRQAAGLSQEELAERAGLSARTVGDLERGASHAPRKDTVELLAQALALGAPERAALAEAARRLRAASSARPGPAVPSSPPLVGRRRELALPAWTLPPEQERRLMVQAVLRFLANVAGPAGTLLVLDDLQWAGPDALDLLAMLVRSPSLVHKEKGAWGESVLRVVGAYRHTEVRPADPLG